MLHFIDDDIKAGLQVLGPLVLLMVPALPHSRLALVILGLDDQSQDHDRDHNPHILLHTNKQARSKVT